jgi:hypothetical protein
MGDVPSFANDVMRRKRSHIWLYSILLHACLCPAGERKKTDIVYMNNGDKLTCEIKLLQQGQLNVKPDYTVSGEQPGLDGHSHETYQNRLREVR